MTDDPSLTKLQEYHSWSRTDSAVLLVTKLFDSWRLQGLQTSPYIVKCSTILHSQKSCNVSARGDTFRDALYILRYPSEYPAEVSVDETRSIFERADFETHCTILGDFAQLLLAGYVHQTRRGRPESLTRPTRASVGSSRLEDADYTQCNSAGDTKATTSTLEQSEKAKC